MLKPPRNGAAPPGTRSRGIRRRRSPSPPVSIDATNPRLVHLGAPGRLVRPVRRPQRTHLYSHSCAPSQMLPSPAEELRGAAQGVFMPPLPPKSAQCRLGDCTRPRSTLAGARRSRLCSEHYSAEFGAPIALWKSVGPYINIMKTFPRNESYLSRHYLLQWWTPLLAQSLTAGAKGKSPLRPARAEHLSHTRSKE